jgi:SAM-dependent methyltransferase
MVKLSKKPYESKDVVEVYEERYIHHPLQADDINFEIKTTESLLNPEDKWCDVACGTSYHLRKAKGSFERYGVDRSHLMVNEHIEDTEYKVNYFIEDLLYFNPGTSFNLVTNFWFGYSHQETLNDVLKFFEKMIEITNKGGSIILSVHNNWKLFDSIPRLTDEPMGGVFRFDSLNWSYKEPSTGHKYNCISPHKDLIVETFKPYFKKLYWKDYPNFAGKELLILEEKECN